MSNQLKKLGAMKVRLTTERLESKLVTELTLEFWSVNLIKLAKRVVKAIARKILLGICARIVKMRIFETIIDDLNSKRSIVEDAKDFRFLCQETMDGTGFHEENHFVADSKSSSNE